MRKSFHVAVTLAAVLVLVAGTATTLAAAPSRITGSVYFSPAAWGSPKIQQQWNVLEVNSVTHEATGTVKWQVQFADGSWRRLKAKAECVLFNADRSAATVTFEIVGLRGVGEEGPGWHGVMWVHDAGTPSNQADQWGMWYPPITTEYPDWHEFWSPERTPPTCTVDLGPMPTLWDSEAGNVMIH